MKLNRTWKLTIAGVALAACGFVGARAVAAGRAHERGPLRVVATTAPATELHVPHATGAIVLDGDTDDPGWAGAVARTGAFVGESGAEARPYSEARFAWGDGHLYVMLYAADEDIHASHASESAVWLDDAFHLVFAGPDGERAFDVSAKGAVTDGMRRDKGPFDWTWSSGAHVSYEMDGTPDEPKDDDEEWVLELAIPFDALGLEGERGERVGLAMHRCDTPKHMRRVCGSYGESGGGVVLVLD